MRHPVNATLRHLLLSHLGGLTPVAIRRQLRCASLLVSAAAESPRARSMFLLERARRRVEVVLEAIDTLLRDVAAAPEEGGSDPLTELPDSARIGRP
jgi:hypothetical protein